MKLKINLLAAIRRVRQWWDGDGLCGYCKGTGKVLAYFSPIREKYTTICPMCQGTGKESK